MVSPKDRLSLRALGKKAEAPSQEFDVSGQSSSAAFALKAQLPIAKKENHGQSKETPAYLTRLPDIKWIDIEMMGYWLQKCDSEHGGKCRKPLGLDPAHLGGPKWLINVQKMCLSAAESNNRYACLSYVWGNVATLKTGKSNIKSLLEENSLDKRRDEIPKTIRDTIGLCAQLGIPYLWVDALCIVQDDAVSKHNDIQAMAGIYANAYVTLIAGNGWDANHGLRGIQGVTEPRHLASTWKPGFIDGIESYDSIWYSRGWTFQEMVFSPRKIMFAYQLAIWECNNESWHEASLSTIPAHSKDSTGVPKISSWQVDISLTEEPDFPQYIALARDYARRKLTYAEDSLHAITSLLSVMSSSFTGGFVSGLPECLFDRALLWQPAEPMQRRQSASIDDTPPSYSWIGWEGELSEGLWLQHCNLVSAVTWFYGNTKDERIPIKVSRYPQKDQRRKPKFGLNPPSSWFSKSSSNHGHVSIARYLFCHTQKARFKCMIRERTTMYERARLLTYIEDDEGRTVGALNLSLGLTSYAWPPGGSDCELVMISEGQMGDTWGPKVSLLDFQADLLQDNKLGTSHVMSFYNVLWIEWRDGVAYRKALGQVLKGMWDHATKEDLNLILG